MSPRQRMLAIRLSEKLAQNPEYAQNIGIEISNKKLQGKTQINPSQSCQLFTVSNTIY